MPLFTVIIPVFKVEKMLKRCIGSILRQKIQDFEIILVDDGSTDTSGQICATYVAMDNRVLAIHKNNKGVSSARNDGLKVASGKYVAFVDADDTVTERYLESLMPFDTDLVLCGIEKMDLLTQKTETISFIQDSRSVDLDSICQMAHRRGMNYCYAKRYTNALIKKENILFHEDLNLGEDTLFLIEYLTKCKSFAYSDIVAYCYYYSGANSLSSFGHGYVKNLVEAHRREITALETIFPDIGNKEPFPTILWSVFYYSIFYILSEWNVSMKEKKRALKEIFELKEFQQLKENIDHFMINDPVWLRRVISTGNTDFVLFMYSIIKVKHTIMRSCKNKGWFYGSRRRT